MYVCDAIFFVLTCLLILTTKEIGDGVVARTLCGTSEYMVRPMVWYLRFLFIHITVLIRLLRCWHAPATARVWTGGPWELSFLRWCQFGSLFRPARRRTWPQVHCANLPEGQHPLADEGTAWEGHVCAAVTITLSISTYFDVFISQEQAAWRCEEYHVQCWYEFYFEIEWPDLTRLVYISQEEYLHWSNTPSLMEKTGMPLPASKDIAPPINLYSLQQKGSKDVQAPTTDANGTPTLTSFFFSVQRSAVVKVCLLLNLLLCLENIIIFYLFSISVSVFSVVPVVSSLFFLLSLCYVFFFRSKKRSSQGMFVKPTVVLSW